MTDRYVGRIHFLAHDRPIPLPRSWARSPASEAIRRRQARTARLRFVATGIALGMAVVAGMLGILAIGLVLGAVVGVEMGGTR